MKAMPDGFLILSLWMAWVAGVRGAEFGAAAWVPGGDQAALVHVAEGTRRVRLLTRAAAGGDWSVHGIVHLDGRAGTVKVRVPEGVALADIALEASRTDPFPHSFYAGRSTFDPVSGAAVTPLREGGLVGPGVHANDAAVNDAAGPAAVQESDIWKWRDRTLYYFNTMRGLQVFDLSDREHPRRVAGLRLPAVGEDMYLVGTAHVALLANRPESAWETEPASGPRSEVVIVRHEGSGLTESARLPVEGAFMEGRMVGSTLCVLTQQTVASTTPDGGTAYHARQQLYAIDLSVPEAPVVRGPLEVTPVDGAWVWQPVVQATSDFLFIATTSWRVDGGSATWLSVIDLREGAGALRVGARLPLAGQVRTRFQIAQAGDIVTTVSENAGAVIETWNLTQALAGAGPGLPRPLDSLLVGANEGLFAARFDGPRVHVVTFRRIDPLFCIDLSNPSNLRLLGELEVPGFSTYLEAFADGTRLVSLGVEDGRVAVSLFDVGNPAAPTLRRRLHFGDRAHGSWSEGNYDDKAIGFFRDAGLMLFPLQEWTESAGYRGGMQLVDVTADGLRARGFVGHQFHARRGRLFDDTLVSIGAQELFVLDVADRDRPRHLASLTIAWPVRAVLPHGDVLVQLEDGDVAVSGGRDAVARPPRLRVTSKEDLDVTLAELPLASSGAVAGSVRRADTAYILLRSVEEVRTKDESGQESVAWTSVLTTVVVDLQIPTRPVVRGSVRAAREGYDWGNGRLEASWLPDGRLLWYPTDLSGQSFWWRGPGLPGDVVIGVPVADAPIGRPWRWGGGRPDDLLVLDIGQADSPRVLLREPVLAPDTGYSTARVHAVGPARLIVSWTAWAAAAAGDGWAESSQVQEIDLSDPARLRRGPAAAVPAMVTGAHRTAAGGIALFAAREETVAKADGGPSWTGAALVDALAFDGTRAFLLDTTRIDQAAWRPTAVAGAHFFAVVPPPDGEAGSRLKPVRWDESTGRWSALPEHMLGLRWPSLTARGGYLFAAEGTQVEMVPAEPGLVPVAPVRRALTAPVWEYAGLVFDDVIARAWLPADAYGVETLDLSGLSVPSPAARPLPREKTGPEWQRLPLAAVDIVTASAPQPGSGALTAAEDFAFAADSEAESYEAWAVRHFGGMDPEASGVVADPDRDGFDNYSEWAFGTSPRAAESVPQVDVAFAPAEGEQPARLLMAARLNPMAQADPVPVGSFLVLSPERRDAGSGWSPLAREAVELMATPIRRVWSIPVPADADSTFVRLRVFFVREG